MGIFDFFRDKKEESKKNEVISHEELSQWTENKISESQNQKTKFHALIKNRVSKLSEELKHGTDSFKNINWEKIKVEERIKQIVKENLNNYESHLASLMQELNNLKESELNKERIYEIFSSFDKRTAMNYQKSTYLIGKELEYINKSVSLFFKDIGKIHNENKEFIIKAEALSNIKRNLKELEESDKTIARIREDISNIEKEIALSENKIKDYENSLSEIQKGEQYLKWNNKKEEFQEKNENLKREMQNLQSFIDFKALARTWHENPPEMQILTDYRSNFNFAFHKDKGEVLARLTNSLENKETISEAILNIIELEKEIQNIIPEESPSISLEKEIQSAKEKISSLHERKSAESRKADKLTLARTPIINAITSNLSAFNPNMSVIF